MTETHLIKFVNFESCELKSTTYGHEFWSIFHVVLTTFHLEICFLIVHQFLNLTFNLEIFLMVHQIFFLFNIFDIPFKTGFFCSRGGNKTNYLWLNYNYQLLPPCSIDVYKQILKLKHLPHRKCKK